MVREGLWEGMIFEKRHESSDGVSQEMFWVKNFQAVGTTIQRPCDENELDPFWVKPDCLHHLLH